VGFVDDGALDGLLDFFTELSLLLLPLLLLLLLLLPAVLGFVRPADDILLTVLQSVAQKVFHGLAQLCS